MTRTEFVQAYARRSGKSDEYAALGIINFGSASMIALPCACEDECEGWAMVDVSGVDDQLLFNAPEELRVAYRKAISAK